MQLLAENDFISVGKSITREAVPLLKRFSVSVQEKLNKPEIDISEQIRPKSSKNFNFSDNSRSGCHNRFRCLLCLSGLLSSN